MAESIHALIVSDFDGNRIIRACSQKVYLYAHGKDKDGAYRPVVSPSKTFTLCVLRAAQSAGIPVRVVDPVSALSAVPAAAPKPKPTMEEIEEAKAGKLFEWAREYQVPMAALDGEPLHPQAKPNYTRYPGADLRVALLEGLGYVKLSKDADPEDGE